MGTSCSVYRALKTSVIQPAIGMTLFSQDVIDAFFSNLK